MKPTLSLKSLDSKIELVKDSLLELYLDDRKRQKDFNESVHTIISDIAFLFRVEVQRAKRFRISFAVSLVLLSISVILSCF